VTKQRKHNSKGPRAADGNAKAGEQPLARPPAPRPVLLAVSVGLFALWVVFLLVTALRVGL
jgi:hypothetical protein